jgi:Co/Zn/Cd efflux system component
MAAQAELTVDDHVPIVYDWVMPALRAHVVLGCLSSLFVVYSFGRFSELRKRAFRLVFWLSVADLGANLTVLLPFDPDHESSLCIPQAMSQQFFSTASVLWPLIIAFTMYSAVVLRGIKNSYGNCIVLFTENHEAVHILVWGISFASCLPPLITNEYGPAGNLTGTQLLIVARFC